MLDAHMGILCHTSCSVARSLACSVGLQCDSCEGSIRAHARNVSGNPLYHASNSASSRYHRSRSTCWETPRGPLSTAWLSAMFKLSPELIKLTIFDNIHTKALQMRSSFMTSSPSGYPVAAVLLGSTKPMWSSCRPASVHSTKSSVFNLV